MSVSKSEKAVLTAGMLLAAVAGCSPAWAAGPVIVATVDHAKLVKIPVGTETLIIGNPTIADITMLKQNNLMILTPKSFGETNFIALDKDGAPLAESVIQVVNGVDALVVQRGMDRQSYSCAPRCQPTERLGDDDKYLNQVANQAQAHSTRLANVAAPVAPGVMPR